VLGPGGVGAHRAALVRRRRARILVVMTAAEDLRKLFETQRGCARVPGVSSQAFPHIDADVLTLGTLRPRPLPPAVPR
jgi:hypothetical protein